MVVRQAYVVEDVWLGETAVSETSREKRTQRWMSQMHP